MAFVAAVPAIEWNAIGGADLANAVRLGYFTILALGSVYLGVRRQDLGDASPVSGRNAALAPLFAGAVLGGLYFLIKYSTLNPALLYQFFGCLFALLATSEVLQPFLGLALSGNLLDEEAPPPTPPPPPATNDRLLLSAGCCCSSSGSIVA